MKFSVCLISLFVSSTLLASWGEDFEQLKNRPRSYEDIGAICEELARLKFEKQFNNSQYIVEMDIEYGDSVEAIGELDVVIFDRSKNSVIQVSEVKCWKDMDGGLRKAREQRGRFLKTIKSPKQIYLRSTDSGQRYSADQFRSIATFTTIGPKGSTQAGYDEELEYDMRDLRRMGMEMLRCQDRGECAKP